jgi:hypothetical protein
LWHAYRLQIRDMHIIWCIEFIFILFVSCALQCITSLLVGVAVGIMWLAMFGSVFFNGPILHVALLASVTGVVVCRVLDYP